MVQFNSIWTGSYDSYNISIYPYPIAKIFIFFELNQWMMRADDIISVFNEKIVSQENICVSMTITIYDGNFYYLNIYPFK